MDLLTRIHSEAQVDGFTQLDGTVKFFNFVKAIYKSFDKPKVLDLGAGRGAWMDDKSSKYIYSLRDLREGSAHVTAADVDPVVLNNRCSHKQVCIDENLPFDDGCFDIVVCDYVFEHISEVPQFAEEVQRVLTSGGWLCARTANKWGYVALLTSLIPNKLHAAFLKHIQPDRKEVDVFPTAYKLNSVRSIKNQFNNFEIYFYRDSAEPAYHFNNVILYRLFLLLHKILPSILSTGLCIFLKKK